MSEPTLHDDTDGLPPQDEVETHLQAARRRFVQAKIDAGWKHDGNSWIHPSDDQMTFIADPFTGEIIFSAKMAEQLDQDGSADELLELIRQDIERHRQSGPS